MIPKNALEVRRETTSLSHGEELRLVGTLTFSKMVVSHIAMLREAELWELAFGPDIEEDVFRREVDAMIFGEYRDLISRLHYHYERNEEHPDPAIRNEALRLIEANSPQDLPPQLAPIPVDNARLQRRLREYIYAYVDRLLYRNRSEAYARGAKDARNAILSAIRDAAVPATTREP